MSDDPQPAPKAALASRFAGPGTSPGQRPIPEGQKQRKYDWPLIRRAYIEGVKDEKTGMWDFPTLDGVAAQFNVSTATVKERAAREKWRAERDARRGEVETLRRQARARSLAQTATQVEGKATEAATLGLQLVQARLREIGQAQATRQRGGDTVAAAAPAIDALEMTRLGQAADLFHKLALRALGIGEAEVRVELTGANGGPIEITQELARDDPTRTANVLGILEKAGLRDVLGGAAEPILDVDVVDDAGGDAGS